MAHPRLAARARALPGHAGGRRRAFGCGGHRPALPWATGPVAGRACPRHRGRGPAHALARARPSGGMVPRHSAARSGARPGGQCRQCQRAGGGRGRCRGARRGRDGGGASGLRSGGRVRRLDRGDRRAPCRRQDHRGAAGPVRGAHGSRAGARLPRRSAPRTRSPKAPGRARASARPRSPSPASPKARA